LKRCSRCKDEFPATPEYFPRNKNNKDGLGIYHKACHNAIGNAFLASKGGTKDYHLRQRYGVTEVQFRAMVADQGGLCAICGVILILDDKRTAHQDHNHETNKPRGVLCSSCNQGLGNFKDDIDRLESAIKYLTSWQE
jgi:hypothetical protein